jgi:Skp family chaperone for outer membrane proteins
MNEVKRSVRWYEVAYVVVLLGVLAVSMTYLKPHRIGVINMDTAFKKLGVADQLTTALREKETRAKASFDALQKQAAGEEKAILDAFKAAQTDEQKAKVQSDFVAYQTRMQKSRAEITEPLQRFQRDAVISFRERMRPYVQKVAGKKRVDMVIEPEQVYQIMNNALDLTEPIIDEAKASFTPDQPLVDEALLKSKGLWIEEQKPVSPAPAPTT